MLRWEQVVHTTPRLEISCTRTAVQKSSDLPPHIPSSPLNRHEKGGDHGEQPLRSRHSACTPNGMRETCAQLAKYCAVHRERSLPTSKKTRIKKFISNVSSVGVGSHAESSLRGRSAHIEKSCSVSSSNPNKKMFQSRRGIEGPCTESKAHSSRLREGVGHEFNQTIFGHLDDLVDIFLKHNEDCGKQNHDYQATAAVDSCRSRSSFIRCSKMDQRRMSL